jgi:hypothetical protein
MAWLSRTAVAAALALVCAEAHADGGLALGIGADYRILSNRFYFYPGGASEADAGLVGLGADVRWEIPVGPSLRLSPGMAVGVAGGSTKAYQSSGLNESQSSFGWHVEAFGEGRLALSDAFAAFLRAGVGVTGNGFDAADEGATNVLVSAGVEIGLTQRLALGLAYQIGVANLSAWTDGGVTGASPGLERYSNMAAQARLVLRL